jgi:hypothetical protein
VLLGETLNEVSVVPTSKRLLPVTEISVELLLVPLAVFIRSPRRPPQPERGAPSEIELCHCACWSLWE